MAAFVWGVVTGALCTGFGVLVGASAIADFLDSRGRPDA